MKRFLAASLMLSMFFLLGGKGLAEVEINDTFENALKIFWCPARVRKLL